MFVLKALSLLLLVAVSTEGLSCIECNPEKCVDPEGCKGGLVPDVCYCCRRCAKVLDDDCGGPWNLTGICDQGLICDKPVDAVGVGINPNYSIGKCQPKN